MYVEYQIHILLHLLYGNIKKNSKTRKKNEEKIFWIFVLFEELPSFISLVLFPVSKLKYSHIDREERVV